MTKTKTNKRTIKSTIVDNTQTTQTQKTITIVQICRDNALNDKSIRSKIRAMIKINDDARHLFIDCAQKNATHKYTYDAKLRAQLCDMLSIDDIATNDDTKTS